MKYAILLLFTIAAVTYSVITFLSRYRLKKKNEELRDRYVLLRDSIEMTDSRRRAGYRISHEREKIDTIRDRLKDKYGEKIMSERKLLEEIIGYEKERAELLCVDFDWEITRNADELLVLFSTDECIAFFLNLLDNALEAAAASGRKEKTVRLSAGKELRLENSKSGKDMPSAGTTKDDTGKHGFGLGIIEQYCREHGLDLMYRDKGEMLITEVKITN